jgi:hypothetical protein
MKVILSVMISLALVACQSASTLEERLTGAWTMHQVYEYDADVTEKHNPSGNRWVEFNSDGTFVSDGDPFGQNTGRWKADNETTVLIIDSDVDDDDSEWNVSFEGNLMIWTGIGHPRKENTRLVHQRKTD